MGRVRWLHELPEHLRRRGAQLLDVHGRRCAPKARLVVEVDGGYHEVRVTADARRTRWLERQGYRVVRVSGEQGAA